jgi:hypothetical protein
MKNSLSSARQNRLALVITTTITVLLAAGFVTRTAFMQGKVPQREASTTVVAERVTEWPGGLKGGGPGVRTSPPENDEANAAVTTTPNALEVASNYAFTTAANASLTDMSSGTTQLIAADSDDNASVVTLIGFDFFFQGVRQDRFSVNANGSLRFGATVIGITLYDPLAQAGQSLITAYGADQRTHAGDGKVHFKVMGAEPNRVLIVEWLNTQSTFNIGGTADLTYQVRLYETTGAIEFVYGSMFMSAVGAGDSNSNSPQIGFSSNNSVGTVGSVTAAQTGTPAPTYSGASATPVNNLYVAGTITALDSAVDGSRRIFSYASPTPTAPTGLTFSAVGTVSYTLNWTDSPDELAYSIYRSTDGVNFTFDGTAALNATSYNATVLNPATTYFWKVFANTEGALSTALTGSQATLTPNSVTSVGTGLWSSPGTWSGGSVPTTNDSITIANGHTVTIDTAATALNVTVASGGVLQYEQTTARTLTLPLSATIDSGGIIRSNPAGTQTGHVLSVGSDLTNNGTLDFSTNADTAGAGITFTGVSNNTFSGTGATTDIRQITVNKGTSNTNIIELLPSNFTVRGVTTDTVVGGWLVMANGTIKISGTFAGTNRVFASAGYTIIATAGFWLNNPNYTVAGQNGSPTESGMLRVSQGAFNIGTATGNAMGFSTGSTITVEGGAVNGTSRFGVAAAGNSITYTQTAGTITVNTIGNASATLGSFDLGTSTASTISMTGGTVVTQINATAIDYRMQSAGGPASITGGTLQLGNAASGAAKTFIIRGVAPNVVITNTSANHTGAYGTTLVNFNNSTLNETINSGTTFNIGNTTLLFFGTTLTNNGTLTANGVSSNFVWDRSSAPMTYSGSGTVTAPMTNMSFLTGQTVTFSPASSNITVGRLNMNSGGPINSNKLTLGNGGATTAIIQFGTASPTSTVLGFDVPPVFNPGTGGVNLLYTPELTGRTTGNEIPPSRTLNLLSITNPNNITIAGGDITVTGAAAGAIALNGGRVITGANTLYFNSAAGTVVQTIGYVDGNFKKSYAAAGSKLFEVGTANGYSPVTVNATAGNFPTDFTVAAIQGPDPAVNAATSIQRYWALTGAGVTADLTFQYLVGDVMGTEGNYKVIREIGGSVFAFPASTVNTGAHSATVTGVSSFSNWTVGEIASPTAAPATISGVVTRSDGMPLGGVSVNLSGGHLNIPTRTITDGNGQYRFTSVETNGFYVVTPGLANYSFSPANRSFSLMANKTDAVFTATAAAQTENPLNGGDFFVRQQYLDFLGREPDQAGWLYWSDQIAACGLDQNCIVRKRLDVSAAFFISEEFQLSGNYIYRLYRAALGRQLSYSEFTDDHNKVIGGANLEFLRAQFADEFVQRPEFTAKYQNAVQAETFVDALLQGVLADTQVDLSSQRDVLLATYNNVGNNGDVNRSRSAVMRALAERGEFQAAIYDQSFVLMEYFGYLRRDIDRNGFDFWVNVLNNRTPGNYRGMVCSFITSVEYQQRFSPVVTHSNAECGR